MNTDDLRQFGVDVYDRWTAMWNGEAGLAERIMAPRFTLRYAQAGTEAFDSVTTPQQLTETIAAWHRARPGLRFTAEGPAVVDLRPGGAAAPPSGLVARPYRAGFTAEDGAVAARSGTDTLRVVDGLITEVWSVSSGAGGRTFYR
ncbi:hypothetical protein [Streptomyces sp. NPDC090445]|uniref:hypothetical protein n=1 Tax=Streptomyces sp. NPDC090445 TaxID=3365963 RepID=UPI00380A99BF